MGVEVRAAIPFFFALIFVEFLVGGARLFRLNDSIADLGAGIGQQVFAIPLNAILVGIYAWLSRTTALMKWPESSLWSWIGAFLLVDLAYYWFHRTSHRVNFIWATHIVHHQSEEYNLTVALRQSWIQGLFSMVFYFPLATLGVPLQVALGAIAVNTVGQFWFHTRAIGRMGWLEWVLNTPSHHRVHHGRNPKYLDKNYAGVLIIWDRFFGTFVTEEEEPVYGTVKPLNSWNVVWANSHQWVEVARFCAAAGNWKSKILIWFLAPETLSGQAPEVTAGTAVKFDSRGTRFGEVYAIFIFLTGLAALFVLLAHLSTWSVLRQAVAGALVIWTLLSSGAFLERKPWAKWAEAARLAVIVIFLAANYANYAN
jgi:sterol desaturase/sphingolipid hydroxylase (fatty acid hydroxylase superfamily)